MTTSSNRYFTGDPERHSSNTSFDGLLSSSSDKKKDLVCKSSNKSTQSNRRSRINNYSNANNGNNINSRLRRDSSMEFDYYSHIEEHIKGQILSGLGRKKKIERSVFVLDGHEIPQYRQNIRSLYKSPPPFENGTINNNIDSIAGNFNNGVIGGFGDNGGACFYSRAGKLNNAYNIGFGNISDNYKFSKCNFNPSGVISGYFSENYQLTPIHFPIMNQLTSQVCCNQMLQGSIGNYIPPPPDYHVPQESSLVKQDSFNDKPSNSNGVVTINSNKNKNVNNINTSNCDDTISCGNCGNNINYLNNSHSHLLIKTNSNNEVTCKGSFPFFQTPYSFRSYEISTLIAIDHLIPNMDFYNKINRAVADLRNWIDNMNIPLFVFPYGSTSTGFADQFSDLDIALVPKQDVFESQNSNSSEITIKLKSINSPITDINNKPAGLILQELLNLLQKNSHENSDSSSSSTSISTSNEKFYDHPFTCIQDITSAHVPIIRMLHTDTDIALDISIALCKLESTSTGGNVNNQYSLSDQQCYNICSSPNINYGNSAIQNEKKQNLIGNVDNNRRYFPTLRANSLPIIQSRLGILSWYAKLDPRVVHVVVLTKVWTRLRGLRNTLNGLPGGYAWTICVIYFFQRIGILPVIDPSEFIKKSHEFSNHITNEILEQIASEYDFDDITNANSSFSSVNGLCEDGSILEITNFPILPIEIKSNSKNEKNNNLIENKTDNDIDGSNYFDDDEYNNDNVENNNKSPNKYFDHLRDTNDGHSDLLINNESSIVEIENEISSTIESEKEVHNVKLLYLDVVKGNGSISSNSIKNSSNNINETQSLLVNNNNTPCLSKSPEKVLGFSNKIRINKSEDLLEYRNSSDKSVKYNKKGVSCIDMNSIKDNDDNDSCDNSSSRNIHINDGNSNSYKDLKESTPELSFMCIKNLSLNNDSKYIDGGDDEEEEYDQDAFGESGRSSIGSTTFTYSPSPDNQSSDNLFNDSNNDPKCSHNCACSHFNRGNNEDSYYCDVNSDASNKDINNKSKTNLIPKTGGCVSSALQSSSKSVKISSSKSNIEVGVENNTVTRRNKVNRQKTESGSELLKTLTKLNLDKAYNNTINILFRDPPKLLSNVKTLGETSKYLKFSQSHILFYRFLLFLETHLWTTVIDISSPEIITTTSPGICCDIRNPFPGTPACKPIFDQYHQKLLKSEIQRAIQIIQSPCGDFSSICGGCLDTSIDSKNNIICGFNKKVANNMCVNFGNSSGNGNLNNNIGNGVNYIVNGFNQLSNNRGNVYRDNFINCGFINSNFNCNCSHCNKFIQIHSRNNAQTSNNHNHHSHTQHKNNHNFNKNKRNNQNTRDHHNNKNKDNHKTDFDFNSTHCYNNVGLDVGCGSSYFPTQSNNNHYIGMGLGGMSNLGSGMAHGEPQSPLYYDGVGIGVDSLQHYVFSPLAPIPPIQHTPPPPLKDPLSNNKMTSACISDNSNGNNITNAVGSNAIINGCKKFVNKQHYIS